MDSFFKLQVAERERAYPPRIHYHGDYEIYYLTEGRCRYFIHNKTYAMTAGDIVMIPPGQIHKVMYETPVHSRILFNCTRDYIPTSVIPFLAQIAHFPDNPDTARSIAELYRKLQDAVSCPDVFSQDTIRCCVMQLFLLIAGASVHNKPLSVSSPIVEQAVAHIRSNFMDRITLTDTARHCAVSPEHLSRVFKKETGFGFNEYLNLYRLKKAEALLKTGQVRSVSRVALQCGFNDSNYFSGMYKKVYGVPPSLVRKQSEGVLSDGGEKYEVNI